MGCGCYKAERKAYSNIRRMAGTEARADKTDYIIYAVDGKTYYDKVTCWEKDGRPGRIIELVCGN